MDSLKNLVRRKSNIKFCPQCKGKLSYTSVLGKYSCKNCGYEEYDLYGQMKQLLEDDPALSKVALSMILNVSMRELNVFIDEDGILNNPYIDIP